MTSDWITIKAADFIDFNPRLSLKKGSVATKVAMDKLQPFTKKIPATEKAEFSGGAKFCNGDTIMARITPCLENGKTAFVDVLEDSEVGFGSTEFIVLRAKEGISDPQFIYYLATSPWFRNVAIKSMVGSSGRQRVQQGVLDELELTVPLLPEQQKIGAFLAMFDEKIALNNKINDNLQQQLEALYLGTINVSASECGSVTLDEWCHIFTGKKNANHFDEDGQYMFFTCGEKPLRINSYIYDGPAIIVSGNGSYTGRTLFYNGKFDLYQRTYACTLKESLPADFIFGLFAVLKIELHAKIAGGTHGSSIPYIVMNDLAKFEFPYSHDEFTAFSGKAKTLLTAIQHNQQENEVLSQIRDALLPRLMSGELDVTNLT